MVDGGAEDGGEESYEPFTEEEVEQLYADAQAALRDAVDDAELEVPLTQPVS